MNPLLLLFVAVLLIPAAVWWVVSFVWKRLKAIFVVALVTILIALVTLGGLYGPDIRRAMELDLTMPWQPGWLELGEITPLMSLALQAAEDERFAARPIPVDPRSVARAMKENVLHGRWEGASTITMQVARAAYLPRLLTVPGEQTLRRKLMEVVLAWRIHMTLSKPAIEQLYFNTVPFAGGATGFRTASLRWFGRQPKELTGHEVYALVYSARAPGRINTREELRESAAKFILNAAPRKHIVVEPGTTIVLELNFHDGLPVAPTAHLASRPQDAWPPSLLEEHRRALVPEMRDRIDREHLAVHSTIDLNLQAALHETAVAELKRLEVKHPGFNLEVAVAVVSVSKGEVLALVQRDPQRPYSFNTQAKRQIGSLQKPLLLLAALQTKRYTIACRMLDAPLAGGYPRNLGNKRYGWLTLKEALDLSVNTVFVKLYEDDTVKFQLTRLHSNGSLPPPSREPSAALGTVETSNLQVAAIYAAIASGGAYYAPRVVERITSTDEKTVVLDAQAVSTSLGNSREIAAIQTAMRSVYTHGTAANLPRGLLGGAKTGTTSFGKGDASRDLRFVYIRPGKFAVSVWVGAERGSLWPGAAAGTDLSRLAGNVFTECERLLQ